MPLDSDRLDSPIDNTIDGVIEDGVIDRQVVGDREWVRRLLIPLTIIAWGLIAVVLFFFAGHVVDTLIMIAVGMLVAYALVPLVNWLDRWLPRWLAITLTYLLFIGVLAGLVYLIAGTLSSEVRSVGPYVRQLFQRGGIQSLLGRFGIPSSALSSLGSSLGGSFSGAATGLATHALPIVTGVANILIGIVVAFVLSIYFVADATRIGRWLRTQTPTTQRRRVVYFIETLNRVVGGYIRGQATLAALVGLLVGLGMGFLFHLPFAILLGILAFVFEFIPYLGVIASGAACVLVAVTTQGFITALLVLIYFAFVHIIEGEVVGPRIVGIAVGIHPAVSLVALIAGAELFGIWGALFAAPLAGVIQSLVATFWREYQQAHPELFPNTELVPSESEHRSDVFFRRRSTRSR